MGNENSGTVAAGVHCACSQCGTEVIVVKPTAAALSCCGTEMEGKS